MNNTPDEYLGIFSVKVLGDRLSHLADAPKTAKAPTANDCVKIISSYSDKVHDFCQAQNWLNENRHYTDDFRRDVWALVDSR